MLSFVVSFIWSLVGCHGLRPMTIRMGVVTPGNFKNGLTVEFQDSVWKILSFQQTKSARQAAMVRTKLKNLMTGATVDQTFRISEALQTANVEKADAIFSYVDGDNLIFMNSETFDETMIPAADIESSDLLREGMTVQLITWESNIVDVNLPTSEEYEVTYTEPGIAKAASTKQMKPATLDTGAEISVPIFVDIGDTIKVNCAERTYLERVQK